MGLAPAEVMACSADDLDTHVIERMIRLMRRDLRAGKRIVYDERGNLIDLRARIACAWRV